MIPVKVCGITSAEDGRLAIAAGASALGLIFYRPSPRCVDVEQGAALAAALPATVAKVGVFVNESLKRVREIVERVGLDFVQLHGNENQDYGRQLNRPILKTIKIGPVDSTHGLTDYPAHAFLLDNAAKSGLGGTGIPFDWTAVNLAQYDKPVILAGGLTSGNVLDGIRLLRPAAIDVNSGVESGPGKKDPKKLIAFFEVIKNTGPYKNIFQLSEAINHAQ